MNNNIDLTIYSSYNASLMLAVNNLSEDFWLNVNEYSDNKNYSFFGYAFGGGSAKDILNPDKWILIKDTDLLSIRPSENPNATPDSVYEWDVYNGLVIGLKDDQLELFDYYKIPFIHTDILYANYYFWINLQDKIFFRQVNSKDP